MTQVTRVRFAVVDSSGAIKWWGYCLSDALQAQAQHGAASVDISNQIGWNNDPTGYYYDFISSTMRARQIMPVVLPTSASVNQPISISGVPAGTEVLVDGVSCGIVDSTGSESLTMTDAGSYQITLQLWPYLPLNGDIIVS